MGKFVVIVLDGFGVGAMPDVPQVRPADCGANTCVHIFERTPDLKLPNLASLGLANIVGREFPGLPFATDATFGRAELMHDGADTFFGHQEIMGTRPAKPFGEPICNKIELIKKTLEDAGYHVRYYTGTSGKRLLIVNEACTVARPQDLHDELPGVRHRPDPGRCLAEKGQQQLVHPEPVPALCRFRQCRERRRVPALQAGPPRRAALELCPLPAAAG